MVHRSGAGGVGGEFAGAGGGEPFFEEFFGGGGAAFGEGGFHGGAGEGREEGVAGGGVVELLFHPGTPGGEELGPLEKEGIDGGGGGIADARGEDGGSAGGADGEGDVGIFGGPGGGTGEITEVGIIAAAAEDAEGGGVFVDQRVDDAVVGGGEGEVPHMAGHVRNGVGSVDAFNRGEEQKIVMESGADDGDMRPGSKEAAGFADGHISATDDKDLGIGKVEKDGVG